MAVSEYGTMGLLRIKEIVDAVQDVRQVPGSLIFRNRVNKVPATDADIIARFLSQGHIADIVADDQKATTYQAARIKFEANLIPNFKLGRTLTQEDIKRLEYLAKNPADDVESDAFEAYFTREAEALFEAIEWREETILIGMELDSFTYSRGGMILNLSWGMPSELKLTATNAWTDQTNATPFSDILNLALIARTKYGKLYNRVKMSTPAFRLATRTVEFTNQVRNFFINAGQPIPSIPYNSVDMLRGLVGTITNMQVELYDFRYPVHPTSGAAPTYTPFLPLNQVILDSTENDRNNRVKDFATGVVTESIVGNRGGTLVGNFVPTTGIFTYASGPADLNPPNETVWAVERGMPRKKDEAMTAVINVGTVTDFIAAGITF